ncbi:MAG: FixH family protein [Bacteroidaceae bacterium]|nr:FixH family protein [Bacteroidaceae bacterium]
MSIRKYFGIGVAVLFGVVLSSCNSNDDLGSQDIEIPGVTFDGDIDCCSAEEALQIYRFIQTVKIIPELSVTIDDKYNVYAYTKSGSFHNGYNDIYFVATKKKNGNYIKNFDITALKPVMLMVKMNMKHSTPVSAGVSSFNGNYLAVKRGWISFVMNTSDAGSWTLAFDYSILGSKGTTSETDITVDALPAGQAWIKSFKVGDDTYYLSLVNPLDSKTGKNTVTAYVSKKSTPATTPYSLAQEQFEIEIDPRMPDMGNHTSPDNVALTLQSDGSYQGTLNLTMTGRWRIHLTVKDAQGKVVAGGDELSDGYSSLYWEISI